MSRQIEIEFSYLESDNDAPPIFPQDLLTDLIDTRVSYAASLDLNIGANHHSAVAPNYRNSINPKN